VICSYETLGSLSLSELYTMTTQKTVLFNIMRLLRGKNFTF
jgi:hypothetical protein